VAEQLEREAKTFPEVIDVASKIGRAELGGDPEPVNNVEVTVTLRPTETWDTGRSKDELVDAMRERMAVVPGIALSFSQPIATRVDELLSGVRAQLAIKVFGDDLDSLAAIGGEVQRVVSGISGAQDVQTEQLLGQPQLLIRIDRAAVARLGLNVDNVLEVVRLAIGGGEAGKVFESQRRFDIAVRYGESYRATPEDIARALIPTPAGGRVPLSQLATIALVEGPKQISREANQRRIVVQANVDGRDLGGFVAEAQAAVEQAVRLPPGYFITWGGSSRTSSGRWRALR
jgi:cobalt-zinc-cadmium resistance protein CzcA